MFTGILGDLEALRCLKRLRGISARLLENSLRGRLGIGNLVLLLVGFQLSFDAAEFMLDDIESLIYEYRGVAGRSVFKVHPVLIVNVEEGAQNALSPTGENILERENHHRRLLAGKRSGKS